MADLKTNVGQSSQRKNDDKSTKQSSNADEARKRAADKSASDDDGEDDDDSDADDVEDSDEREGKPSSDGDVQSKVNKAVTAVRKKERMRAERKATEAAEEAKREAAESSGEFEKLYRASVAENETLKKRLAAAELANLRFEIALRVGLPNPAKNARRLVGEDEDELQEDAEEMLKDLAPQRKPVRSADATGDESLPMTPAGRKSRESLDQKKQKPAEKKASGKDGSDGDDDLVKAVQSGGGVYRSM